MKKLLYVIIAAMLIVLLFFFYKSTLKKEKAIAPQKEVVKVKKPPFKLEAKEIIRQIPSGGVLYVNCTDLKGIYERIKETNFFVQFINLKIFEKLKSDIEDFNEDSSFKLSFDNSLKIIGNDLYASLYYKPGNKEPEILISTLLNDSTSYLAKFTTFIAKNLKTKNKSNEVEKETYNDIDINILLHKEKAERFYYIILDNIGHFSSDIELIKNVIDLSQGNRSDSLDKSSDYIKAAANFRTDRFFSLCYNFLSAKEFQDILKLGFGDKAPDFDEKLKAIDNFNFLYFDAVLNGVIDIAGSINLNEDTSSNEYILYLNELLGAPKASEFSKNVKSEPLFYGSYNSASLTEYYENMIKMAQDEPDSSVNLFEEKFKEFTGISLGQDVLPLFDDEVVYMATDIDMVSSFIPIPNILVAIKLKDTKLFEKVYETVNESLGNLDSISLKEKEYDGYKYKFALTPIGIAPGHGIIDNYYIIFTNPQGFTKLVDDIKSDKEPYFVSEEKKVEEILFSEFNYFSYINIKSILWQIPDLFDKYSVMLQNSMTNENRREFLKKYNEEILPVFETMKAVKYFAWNAYYDKEKKRFLFKSYLFTEDI